MASAQGHVAVVEALVDAGADVNAADVRNAHAAFHPSFLLNQCQITRIVRAEAPGWCELGRVGLTPVLSFSHAACGATCAVNGCQLGGWTPIVDASYAGHVAVVTALVLRGANVSAWTVRTCSVSL